jgi:hypothetical protein
MGKKDKRKEGEEAAEAAVPWKEIDEDPVQFLVAPEASAPAAAPSAAGGRRRPSPGVAVAVAAVRGARACRP